MPSLHSAIGSELAGSVLVDAVLVDAVLVDAVAPAEPDGVPTGGRLATGDALAGAALVTWFVTVTVTVRVGVAVGWAVTVTVARAPGLIGRVELAGSEWLAPPMTTPATRPAAPASNTGRRHQVSVGSAPNIPS